MNSPKRSPKSKEKQSSDMEALRAQLDEANDTLRAIREGEVDAVIVSGSRGEQVFSLVGAESIYRLIVETMKEAAFTVTFEGKILYCNPQFGEFVKRPINQILGHMLNEFVDPVNRSAADALLTIAQEQPVKQRLVFADPDGCLVPAHISANVINQPDGLGICVVATNLTDLENSTGMIQQLRNQQAELKQAEEALQQLNETLEQRVAERTAEVEQLSDQLRALTAELSLTEQRERKRLAIILHDHIQQLLVGAKFSAAIVRKKAKDNDIQQAAKQLADTLDEAILASRSLSAELSPPILHEQGLAAGLEWLGRQMHQKYGLTVEVEADAAAEPSAEPARLFLFESVRELLLNTAKYAQADRAQVRMRKLEKDEIEVTVADNGIGFDPTHLAAPSTTGGFGLFSIRERLKYLGGRMLINAAPGQGSKFTLMAPAARSKKSEARD